ncbi:rhamnulokinase [Egibacter rhizosphaerae]|uniref:Rhamnulokinase n=1 Tax=Egibacter rhizosphaerae TaxID=1670831 RepID=A0A411YG10_9ACTN|nr:FGGY-family carbohydrate kinase [Egibacter rhizosphaerae]QBI20205.1 rhamnulokinase [Egibacter rhizosphaerae]
MSTAPTRVLAVDLGATSVRVASVDLDDDVPRVEIVHRWAHGPVEHRDGTLRWDWEGVMAAVERGLDEALAAGPAASIGVDGWGVDYALLDRDGALVAPPFSHRDARTAGWREVAERLGPAALYERTGIQLMPINTLFQLAAHDRDELARAERLMLLPDLVVHRLTGRDAAEWSNASTTALVDRASGSWSTELLEQVGVAPRLLPPIDTAGRRAGTWRGVPVHTVGSHDTASAFVAVPGVPGPGTAIISSGTWVLVGAERDAPVITPDARERNFSNEGGALGGTRLLKNVMGFWMLEQCRAAWGDPPREELLAAAAGAELVPTVDATDERFLAPADMDAEVRAAAGLGQEAGRGEVVRCVLASIAAATARVAGELGTTTGARVEDVLVVGGGVRTDLMNGLFAEHTGLPITVGSAEATALGNALVQGIALGRFEDLTAARRWTASAGRPVPWAAV